MNSAKFYISVNKKFEAVIFFQDRCLLFKMWRQQNKGKDLFEEILNDIVKYNPLCLVCFL